MLLIFLSVFLLSFFIRLFTLNQIGRTWDEPEFIEQGYRMIYLISKGDFSNSYFYTTYDHPPLIKYIYGITAHFDVNRYENGTPIFNYDYTYSRILSILFFSIGVIITMLIGWRFFSPMVGVLSGIILSMLPFSIGVSQLVTAESLKIFIYPLVIYLFLLLVRKPTFKNILLSGVIMGIALQIKQSNGLLFITLILMFLSFYIGLKHKKKINYIKFRAIAIFSIIFISVLTFLAFWPQVLFNFQKVYEIHSRLWHVELSTKPWLITLSVPEVFFGNVVMTPNFYYIAYFSITIPLLILILFFIGVKKILVTKKWEHYALIFWFAVPFLLSFYSWRQHGLRYLIEIYPAIAIISAIGFDQLAGRFTDKFRKKLLLFIPIFIYLFISFWYIKPYYLDYFNELVGGIGNVYKSNWFQTGWWGQGLREGGLYVINNAKEGSSVGLAISPDHTLLRSHDLKYSEWEKSGTYDYVIVNHYHIIRDGFEDSIIKGNYNLVYRVKADGATLVYIYKKK